MGFTAWSMVCRPRTEIKRGEEMNAEEMNAKVQRRKGARENQSPSPSPSISIPFLFSFLPLASLRLCVPVFLPSCVPVFAFTSVSKSSSALQFGDAAGFCTVKISNQ